MATAKPSSRVNVFALTGFWKGTEFVPAKAVTDLARREAREAYAGRIARPATEEEIAAHAKKQTPAAPAKGGKGTKDTKANDAGNADTDKAGTEGSE